MIVHLVFLDDSKQMSPTRPGVNGGFVSAGALLVHADRAREAELALAALCDATGFGAEEFKWSPEKKSWMYHNLQGDERRNFFLEVIRILGSVQAQAVVAIEDSGRGTAVASLDTEADVVVLLLERAAMRLKAIADTGLVVADRPGGDRKEEDQFVLDCLDQLRAGTDYVVHEEITFVMTTDSKFVRLLQAADLLVSCATARIAGEATYSPPIFDAALALFPDELGRRGGVSVKIHPDFTFANLYHWLLGDTHFVRYPTGEPLPLMSRPYSADPMVP
jgi:hypothetical protein